ncbi:MAG: mannosyltransferase family protein, partial [Phototrophicaceae bacterium]
MLTKKEYQWVIQPLLAFLISRLIVWAAAYLAEIAIPGMLSDGFYHVDPNNIFLDIWARWDSGFYLGIATKGYSYVVGQQSSVAFFPVYPLLMNMVAQWVGSALLAGVIVSNVLFFGSLVFLYLLTEHEFDSEVAGRAVFYIATFPTAFFFSAVYTESTFLFFLIGSVYFARRRIWGWAVLMGLICSASRIVGFITFGVTGLEWLNSHGWYLGRIHQRASWLGLWRGLRTDWFNLLIIFIIPLGMLSYMRFLGYYFNDPIAFSTVQSAWGRETVGF